MTLSMLVKIPMTRVISHDKLPTLGPPMDQTYRRDRSDASLRRTLSAPESDRLGAGSAIPAAT